MKLVPGVHSPQRRTARAFELAPSRRAAQRPAVNPRGRAGPRAASELIPEWIQREIRKRLAGPAKDRQLGRKCLLSLSERSLNVPNQVQAAISVVDRRVIRKAAAESSTVNHESVRLMTDDAQKGPSVFVLIEMPLTGRDVATRVSHLPHSLCHIGVAGFQVVCEGHPLLQTMTLLQKVVETNRQFDKGRLSERISKSSWLEDPGTEKLRDAIDVRVAVLLVKDVHGLSIRGTCEFYTFCEARDVEPGSTPAQRKSPAAGGTAPGRGDVAMIF